jgi:hypothetical protein
MRAKIENALANFDASAARSEIGGLSCIFITGVSANKESIALQIVNFEPEMNKEYDLNQMSDSAYFTLSYVNRENESFFADGLNGSTGKIKITKINDKKKNIQGMFQFKGFSKDYTLSKTITEGMFNAKFKEYGK